jgi:hypothetical protein
MARPTHDRPALDLDQAAALRRLRAAFGAEQVAVTDMQPTEPLDSNPPPAWQATLLEEAS